MKTRWISAGLIAFVTFNIWVEFAPASTLIVYDGDELPTASPQPFVDVSSGVGTAVASLARIFHHVFRESP